MSAPTLSSLGFGSVEELGAWWVAAAEKVRRDDQGVEWLVLRGGARGWSAARVPDGGFERVIGRKVGLVGVVEVTFACATGRPLTVVAEDLI